MRPLNVGTYTAMKNQEVVRICKKIVLLFRHFSSAACKFIEIAASLRDKCEVTTSGAR